MKLVLLLSVFIIALSVHAQTDDAIKVNELTLQQKIKIVQTFKEFAYAFEKSHPVDPSRRTVFIPSLIKEAHAAAGEPCMVAGWMSSRGSNGLCTVPPESKQGGCGEEQISCGSPIPFGDNICIPFTTPAVRNNAFMNCDKEFEKRKRSLAQVADQVSEEDFNKYIKDVKSVCDNKSTIQSNSAMCRELKSKFAEYIPGDQTGEMGRAQKAIEKGDPAAIEKSVGKLKDELLEAHEAFKRKGCASINKKDPSQYDKYAECAVISKKIVRLNDLMNRSLGVLQSKASEEQCADDPSKAATDLAAVGLSVADKTSCSEAEKKQIANSCAKDIGCMLASDLAGPFLMLSDYIYKPDKSCVSSQNSCIANAVSSAVRSAWSTITGVWDLVKAGWDTVKDKASRLWTQMWGAEDKTSDAQNVIKGLSSEDKDQIAKSPVEWMKGLMTNIWDATQDYLKNDVYCEKWSGSVPGQGECTQPFRGFDCMNCGRRLTSNCAAFGVIAGEVIPAVLTGGITGAAKVGAKGAGAIGKYIKASKAGQAIAKKMSSVPGLAKGASGVATALKTSASAVGASAKAAAERVGKILDAVKNSSLAQTVSKQASALLENPMVRPLGEIANSAGVVAKNVYKGVEKVETSAFNAGMQAVEGTAGKMASATSKLTGASKVERAVESVSEAPVSAASKEARLDSPSATAPPTGIETPPPPKLNAVQTLRELEAQRVDDALKADQARRLAEADRVDEALKTDAARRAAEEQAKRAAEARRVDEALKADEAKRIAEANRVDDALFAEDSKRAIAEAEKEIMEKGHQEVLDATEAERNALAKKHAADRAKRAGDERRAIEEAEREVMQKGHQEFLDAHEAERIELAKKLDADRARRREVQLAEEAQKAVETQATAAREVAAVKVTEKAQQEKAIRLTVESPSSAPAVSAPDVARKFQSKSDATLEKEYFSAIDQSQSAKKKIIEEYRGKLSQKMYEDYQRGAYDNWGHYGREDAKLKKASDSSIEEKFKDDPEFAARMKEVREKHGDTLKEYQAERKRRAEEAARKPLTEEAKDKIRERAEADWDKAVAEAGEGNFAQGAKYNGKVVVGSRSTQNEIRSNHLDVIQRESGVRDSNRPLIAANPTPNVANSRAAFQKILSGSDAPDLKEVHSVMALRPGDASRMASVEMKSVKSFYERLVQATPEELKDIDPKLIEYYKKRLRPYVCFEDPERCR